MTLEILRNQYTYLGQGRKIYAIFDDKTILCFEYQDSVVGKVARSFHPLSFPVNNPPKKGVTFHGSTRNVALLNTPPLPDTNDIYL